MGFGSASDDKSRLERLRRKTEQSGTSGVLSFKQQMELQQKNNEFIRQQTLEAETRAKAEFAAQDHRSQLEKDIEIGRNVIGKDFDKGKLGRIKTGRSDDIKSLIEQRRSKLGGFGAEENQALREQGIQGINRSTQSSLRQLRGFQGASGQRGGSAIAQQGRMLAAGQANKANVERDLFISNIAQKDKALDAFGNELKGAEEGEQQRELFNLQQRQKEIAGKNVAGLGFAGLGVSERTGVRSAEAAASAGGGGGKK